MQAAPRSARSIRRRLARILADGPWSAEINATGAREFLLSKPVEHDGTVYRTLTIRPPTHFDKAHAICQPRVKFNCGLTLTALCAGAPVELVLKLADDDQAEIALFVDAYLSAS